MFLFHQFPLLALSEEFASLFRDKLLTYPSGTKFDIKSVYQFTGTNRFSRVLGGTADIISIKRIGGNPFYGK
jgi:hypothetical protein